MTSEGVFVSPELLTEEYNDSCKNIRDYMIHLWSSARKIKCGDAGWVPPRAGGDPLDAPKEDEENSKK